jgi:S-adenosyl methyltransferase
MSNGGGRSLPLHDEQSGAAPGGGDSLPEIDTGTPSITRIYDYYLGGRENYAADREVARRVLGAAPDVPLAALENRDFLRRSMQFLAREQGIRQFVDIGPGLPTQGNVHQLARHHDPDARVVYVDNDASVLAHGKSLLRGIRNVTMISGDLRDPERILSHPDLRMLIDFSRPVALFMTLVLHFIPAGDDPRAIVGRLRDELCPGSFLVLSHVTGHERAPGPLAEIDAAYDHASAPLIMRSHAEVVTFFDGFELEDPGVVFLSQWRPSGEYHAQGGTRWGYCGVGRKP